MTKLFLSLLAVGVALVVTTQISVAAKSDSPAPVGTAGAFIPGASTDTAIIFTGSTPPNVVGSFDNADATFHRPLSCTALSSVGTAVSYDTISFTNSTAVPAALNVRLGAQGNPAATCPSSIDTVLIQYDGSFDPASPLSNCVAWNDDTPGGDSCSTLTAINVRAGQKVVLVLTTFNNNAAFGYEVNFETVLFPVRLQEFDVK